MAGGECRYSGCKKQGTRVAPYGATFIWVCDEHFELLNKQAEEEEKRIKEAEEKQEKAKEEAKKLMTFGPNEIPFIVCEYEGRPDTYVTLGKKVLYEIYRELIKDGALVKEFDEESKKTYYVITDELKAASVLQKHGFKAISSEEWKERRRKACEILRQAGVLLSSVNFV